MLRIGAVLLVVVAVTAEGGARVTDGSVASSNVALGNLLMTYSNAV